MAMPTLTKGDKTSGRVNEFKDINTKSKSKKIIKLLIIFVALIAIIGSLVAVLVFNVFNIRDQYLRGVLEAIPGVENLLPPIGYGANGVAQLTFSEMELLVTELQINIEQLTAENEAITILNQSQAQTINSMSETLSILEEQHTAFVATQEDFDRMIASEAPQDFTQFFSTMNPEVAQAIFTELSGEQINNEQITEYINRISELSTRNAADTLQEMISGQLELVLNILEAMPINVSGSIINAMSVENRALIITMLAQDITWE